MRIMLLQAVGVGELVEPARKGCRSGPPPATAVARKKEGKKGQSNVIKLAAAVRMDGRAAVRAQHDGTRVPGAAAAAGAHAHR